MKAKLVEASYIEEAKSVLFLVEKDGSQQRLQIHRNDIATFGTRTEKEIVDEMQKYVFRFNSIYRGKEINLVKEEE